MVLAIGQMETDKVRSQIFLHIKWFTVNSAIFKSRCTTQLNPADGHVFGTRVKYAW